MDSFQLLLVLMILEVYLIVHLELKYLIFFLVLLLYHVLLVACQINLQILLYQSILQFQVMDYNYIFQEINQYDHISALFFIHHLIVNYILQNRFLANHYIILKHYHTLSRCIFCVSFSGL